jgi:hypothetical protein
LGWNFNRWGPACFSVEAANVVTADSRLLTVNSEQHTDLFCAIRGGGPGFFGIVTQYRLRLHPAPRAITTSTYFCALERIEELSAWAARAVGQLPRDIELTIFCAPAPPDLVEQCRSSNGFVALLSATAFVDTEAEAAAALAPLESCPVFRDCLHREVNRPTPMEALLDMSGLVWPERQRYLADTLWSDSSPAQQLATLRDCFLQAPSKRSLAVCVFSTGTEAAAAPLPGV